MTHTNANLWCRSLYGHRHCWNVSLWTVAPYICVQCMEESRVWGMPTVSASFLTFLHLICLWICMCSAWSGLLSLWCGCSVLTWCHLWLGRIRYSLLHTQTHTHTHTQYCLYVCLYSCTCLSVSSQCTCLWWEYSGLLYLYVHSCLWYTILCYDVKRII